MKLQCPEEEEAQEAAGPLSPGPMKRGLLPEAIVTCYYKNPGHTQQLSYASSSIGPIQGDTTGLNLGNET